VSVTPIRDRSGERGEAYAVAAQRRTASDEWMGEDSHLGLACDLR
jgi:hypothetical protein